jgi:hypothetical protein
MNTREKTRDIDTLLRPMLSLHTKLEAQPKPEEPKTAIIKKFETMASECV